ncbi:MAG TPA: SusC/RagA family TonB-linked outer membrane protein [Cyclobacteriaceae bacterium]|nr:SusC/RagA family TonB-linked outer membrane protein [Cyclobacteriaceae bacterium]
MLKLYNKKLFNTFLIMVGLSFASFATLAQGTISGVVTDAETGDPVPGVNIFIPSLAKGTLSNVDGTYQISDIPNGSYRVVGSFIGYRNMTENVTVNNNSQTLNFALETSVTQLSEIVVTGTGGPMEKRKIGNSVGIISTESLSNAPITSFSDLLQGREPGMVSIPGGGLTGEGAQIRIRGSASLSQLNEPIIIVDGVRIDNGGGFGAGGFAGNGGGGTSRLDDINPESIARVEILKGAAAATLYGTEASNGVIQIFTKRGATGAPKFDVKLAKGIITYPKGRYAPNVGWARTPAQAATMTSVLGENIVPYQLVSRTFTEDLFETGTNTEASVSASGGTNAVTYYVNGRFYDEDGPFGGKENRGYKPGQSTLAEDLMKRAQLNANVGIIPSGKTKINIVTGYNKTSFSSLQTNNNIYAVGSLAQFSKPERVAANNLTGTAAFATVNESMQQTVTQEVNHYNGSVNINYNPIPWLILDGVIGVDYSNSASENYRPFGWNIDGFGGSEPDGSKAYTNRDFIATSMQFNASATNRISDNIESDFILGTQLIQQTTNIFSGNGVAFPGPGFAVAGAGANKDIYQFFAETVNAGVYAQEQIGFNDHIFVTLGARLDAHSAFGSNFNAQFYPKIAASYVVSDAPYWPGNIGPISTLQFKGSFGQSGLQPGTFDALTTYGAIASTNGAGIRPQNLGNPDLKPEVSSELEVGTSIGLLDGKLTFEATYWDRTVNDALFAQQFPPSGGWRGAQLVNIGELAAKGLELNINATVVNTGDLKVELFANAAYLNEEVISLGGAPPVKVGGSYPRYRNFLVEGYSPGANFGVKLLDVPDGFLPLDYNSDGNPDSRAEVVSYLGSLPTGASLPTTTSIVMLDNNYVTKGEQSVSGHFLGKTTPDWQGSIGGTVTWKNFLLRTNFEYRAGNYYVNNLTAAFRQANGTIGRNLPNSARVERDYYTGGVDANFNPQNSGEVRTAAVEEWVNDILALTPFAGLNTIEKADFVRWRELSLTYRFPTSFTDKLGLTSGSFTTSAKNLALFTGYSGADPEINVLGRGGDGNANSNTDQNFGQGIEAFGWAIPTTVIFTLKVGF